MLLVQLTKRDPPVNPKDMRRESRTQKALMAAVGGPEAESSPPARGQPRATSKEEVEFAAESIENP